MKAYFTKAPMQFELRQVEMTPPADVEVAYFADCLTHRLQGCPSVIDGFNVDQIIEAMAESHRRRARLELDWRGC